MYTEEEEYVYYSAMRRKIMLPFVTWMVLEHVMLSEISQTLYDVTNTWNWKMSNLKKRKKKKPKNQKVKVWLSGDGDGEISLETCNKY